MSVVLDVRPSAFADAAQQLDRIGDGVQVAWMDLLFDLETTVGMAGNDPAGAAWGASYDDAADSACATTQHVLDAYLRVAELLQQTGVNYARAEAASIPGVGGTDATDGWAGRHVVTPSGLCTAPAATCAAPTTAPPGWNLLVHVVGRLWPNGHQNHLHRAAAAWTQAARELQEPLAAADRAIADLGDQRTPEASAAAEVVRGLQAQTHDLAMLYRKIAESCTDYAHQLDQSHHTIIAEVESFVKWTAGIEVAGGVFALFTLGASEIGAQAAESAEALRAAAIIRDAIDGLTAFSEAVRDVLVAVRAQFAEIADAMRAVLERQVVQVQVAGMDARAIAIGGKVEARVAASGLAHGADDAAITAQRALTGSEADVGAIGRSMENWAKPRTLNDHFKRHGRDFGCTSKEDYARQAALFLRRAVKEHLPIKLDVSGTIRFYEPSTNTFASYDLKGMTRTFFKPTNKEAYWDEQPGVLQ